MIDSPRKMSAQIQREGLNRMIRTHTAIRKYRKKEYVCKDVGADDFDRAEQNRRIVSEGLFSTAYTAIENWLRTAPMSRPLPDWIPQGTLPQAGGKSNHNEPNDD